MPTSDFVETLRRRVVRNFLDILILSELKECQLSGYDAVGYIYRKFDVLVSSGTVYGLLYSLERKGLIKGASNEGKRVYLLTRKGEQNIENIEKANREIQNFLTNISLFNVAR
jgi:DNA-binding PadR family transcriptional regulator